MTASAKERDVRNIEKILVYRRTHTGDPDPETHLFGIHDCMASVRDWHYEAVIGIGGSHPDTGDEGIKEKITWVGIWPQKLKDAEVNELIKINPGSSGFRGNIFEFDTFVIWDEQGPSVKDYPWLYNYMFCEGHIPRAAMKLEKFPACVKEELYATLNYAIDMAKSSPHCSFQTPAEIMPSSDSTNVNSRHRSSCVKKSDKIHENHFQQKGF